MDSTTYDEVRRLCDCVRNTKAVVKRRKFGLELVTFLSKAEVRRRLTMEASKSFKRRREVLSAVWRLVVESFVMAMENHLSGKTKLLISDMNMLYKVIVLVDKANEGFENAYSTAKLAKKEAKKVTRLCLGFFEEDAVLNISDPNDELQLLEFLAFICSKKEFVAHFKPHSELQVIMEEVEKRISSGSGAITQLAAATVFANTIETCSSLKMSLNLIMPGAIKLIAGWCATNLTNSRPIALTNLIRGVTLIVNSNPEQAVAPLTRHGRPILSFAKKRYPSADEMQRNALNQFFQCHM
jgi:hypothetical protein